MESPLEWSDTKNVAWKVQIPGLGWSSPAVAEGKIFLTTAVPKGTGLSLRAMALDSQNGNVIWDREVQAVEKTPSIHVKNSHASPTPLVRDGSVFVHFGVLGMARLAINDGRVEWKCNELDYPPLHGSGGSPMLHDGKLVVVCTKSRSKDQQALCEIGVCFTSPTGTRLGRQVECHNNTAARPSVELWGNGHDADRPDFVRSATSSDYRLPDFQLCPFAPRGR